MTINDSVTLVSGATSALIATDLVTSGSTAANYQYVKMVWGADGTINPVNTAGTNGPLPAQLYSNGTQITNTSGRLNVDLQGSGVTLGVTGDVTVSGDVGIVAGTTVGVTGDVSVSATDLDIRGLTFGTSGYSGDALGSFDSVIVQGATGAFPVTAALGFITADGSVDYFGKSGDALKVALTDS
ncbi:MAG TPA: hypothetical protein DCX27_18450, partial [Balneola sp.]|nr:hypothetical protein [Balneola sp.]